MIIIRNGKIVDGTGGKLYRRSGEIRDGCVTQLGVVDGHRAILTPDHLGALVVMQGGG